MFVTLTRDIPHIGKKNERVRVSDAYARNVLIPKGWSIVGEQTAFRITHETLSVSREAVASALAIPLIFRRLANEHKMLYEKISAEDIAETISKRLKIKPVAVHVKLNQAIRALGRTDFPVVIENHTYNMSVNVEQS